MSNHKHFARALGLCVPLALAFASAAGATTIDFTTLSTIYNNGTSFVAGVPPGWTNTQQTNLLSISDGSTLTDGPHNDLYLGTDSQFVATVQITTSLTNPYLGTFGGFYIDTANGYFGLGIGHSGLAEVYSFNNSAQVYQVLAGYTGGPLSLQLVRSGSNFSAYYSTDGGITFTELYTQSGLSGFSQVDLTSFGSAAGETINFTNFNVVDTTAAAPEPASLWLSAPFGLALAWFQLRKRARI